MYHYTDIIEINSLRLSYVYEVYHKIFKMFFDTNELQLIKSLTH